MWRSRSSPGNCWKRFGTSTAGARSSCPRAPSPDKERRGSGIGGGTMTMGFDRVLVPLDGSPESRAILPHLPRLLGSSRAEVLLVRAVPFLATLMELSNGLASGPPSMGSDMSEVVAQVASVERELRDRGIRARGITRVGGVVDLIRQ